MCKTAWLIIKFRLIFQKRIISIILPNWNFVKYFEQYNLIIKVKQVLNFVRGDKMKIRKQEYGNKNVIGRNVERLRLEKGIKQKDFISKMQLLGCDINPTSYSKLEGQVRAATDMEVFVIAKILDIKMEDLF